MRTRCPACNTIFRVTSAQLRLKAGTVRCGSCQGIFNAFDQLVPDADSSVVDAQLTDMEISPVDECPHEIAQHSALPEPEPEAEAAKETLDCADEVSTEISGPEVVESLLPEVAEPLVSAHDALLESEAEIVEPAVPAAATCQPVSVDILAESPEESTQAARQAGLVAARELNDGPSYNRWAAGTLADNGLGGFAGDSHQRAVWPFVLVSVLLVMGLVAQLLYHYRTEVALRLPDSAALYDLFAVDIPLPRNSSLVSIETSDLQSDNVRGLFVLQATLKNRAGYAQAWPGLELSLTDTNDTVVSRRVMVAADYLPPGTKSEAFPANGEVAVKLWIEAKEIGAAGYRLYIFYP